MDQQQELRDFLMHGSRIRRFRCPETGSPDPHVLPMLAYLVSTYEDAHVVASAALIVMEHGSTEKEEHRYDESSIENCTERTLHILHNRFGEQFVWPLVDWIEQISDDHTRARAVSRLVPHVGNRARHRLVDIGLRLREEGAIAACVRSIAHYLSPPQLIDTHEICASLQSADSRFTSLRILASHLTGDAFNRALTDLLASQDDSLLGEVIHELGSRISEVQLSGALQGATRVKEPEIASRIIVALAKHPCIQKTQLQSLLELARRIKSPRERFLASAGVLERLGDLGEASAWEEALGLLPSALRAEHYIDVESFFKLLPAPLLPQVVEIIVTTGDCIPRSSLLRAICTRLDETAIARILSVTEVSEDKLTIQWTLQALAPFLSRATTPLAMQISRAIADDDAVHTLTSMYLHVPNEYRSELVSRLMAIFPSAYQSSQAHILKTILPALSQLQLKSLIETLPAALRDRRERIEVLETIAARIDNSLLPSLFKAVESEPRNDWKKRGFTRLVERLPDGLIPAAIDAAHTLMPGRSRAAALIALLPRVPLDLVPRCVATVLHDCDRLSKESVDSALSSIVPYADRSALGSILDRTSQVGSEYSRRELLRLLAPKLDVTQWGLAAELIESFVDLSLRADACAIIAAAAPERHRARLLQIAVNVLEQLTDPAKRIRLVAILAPEMSDDVRAHWIAMAISSLENVTWSRGRSIEQLAGIVEESSIPTLVEHARAMMHGEDQVQAFRALAPRSQDAIQLLRTAIDRQQRRSQAVHILPFEVVSVDRGHVHYALQSVPDEDLRALIREAALAQLRQAFAISSPSAPIPPLTDVSPSLGMRWVNTGVTTPQELQGAIATDTPLLPATQYVFWFSIGDIAQHSLETRSDRLLEQLRIKEEEPLRVIVEKIDGPIELRAESLTGELRMVQGGDFIVSRQPVQLPELSSGDRQDRLFFPFRTLETVGSVILSCSLYFRNVLLQTREVLLTIATDGWRREPKAHHSDLVYSIGEAISPARLARLPKHALSILQQQGCAGQATHIFQVAGTSIDTRFASFDSQEVGNMIKQQRAALRTAAWGDPHPWNGQAYAYSDTASDEKLAQDLVRIAIAGHRLYDGLINRLAGNVEAARRLADTLREPSYIQIALASSVRLLLPAAFFYDHQGFDDNADPTEYSLCSAFSDSLRIPNVKLEDTPCFKGDCPSIGLPTTVCPSGFWGYRHLLGFPVPTSFSSELPDEIAIDDQLVFLLGLTTDPDFTKLESHEKLIRNIMGARHECHRVAARKELLQVFAKQSPHLVYLFCHSGRMDNDVPCFQVGSKVERAVTRANLRQFKWSASRPLVFINGCNSTAVDPAYALELVSGFTDTAGASGVVGSEITVFEPLACSFAEAFLERFVGDTKDIGTAMREARLQLLAERNPLGLAYTAFALAGLRLSRGRAARPTAMASVS